MVVKLSLHERIFASPETKKLAVAVDEGVARIELNLESEMRFGDALADVAARYLFNAGGKRIRPVLAVLVSQLGSGVSDEIVTAGTAIEMTHLASLYHDDVMDEAPLRRGVSSAHEVWGNSVAILTGDLLFSRANTIMSRLGSKAAAIQTETFERLCLGQLHETIGPSEGDDPVAHYIQVLADKTGSLISAAARCGVEYSGAPEEFVEPLVTFGDKIGVAFQLADDVIDLDPNAADTGKQAGTDLRAGVVTFPTLLLERAAQTDATAGALLARIRSDVSTESAEADADLKLAIAELYAHPVTQATRDEARRWANEAVDALGPLPDGAVKKALSAFAEHVVSRTA